MSSVEQNEGFRFEQWFTHEKRKYPIKPVGYLEPPVVERLTGLRFADWSERVDNADPEEVDLIMILGLIGIAVAQRYPKWEIDRVVRFVRERANDDWVYDNNAPEKDEDDEDEAEGDAVPPAVEADASEVDGDASTDESVTPLASTSDTSPSSTTPPGSPTTTPASGSETSE